MELIKIMNNAHVLIKDNTKYLFSYETCIAQWGGGVLFIVKDWDSYSNSTNKHLYQFIRDYTCYGVYNKRDLLRLINNPKETNVVLVERL
jgi:hypothetical protein